ncbi:MAG: ABC transporter permease [Chloroflexi bacterium]|nr:ABC transporter permease [Chloroflexota bacterium]
MATSRGVLQQRERRLLSTVIELLRRLILVGILGLVGAFLLGAVLQLYVDMGATDPENLEGLFPSVDAIRQAWDTHQDALINEHIPATWWPTLTGLALGTGLGLLLAAIMDLVPPLRWILYPLIIVSQTIPIFAVAVLLILVFGLDFGPKIVVVTLFCFFPITINTLSGLQSTKALHTKLARSLGANRFQTWWKVRLPTALPSFFSGLRIAATYSVVGAVIGEFVGSGDGLGKSLQRSYRAFATDQVYLVVVIITALSMLLVFLVTLIEMLALRWRYAGQQQRTPFQQIATMWRVLKDRLAGQGFATLLRQLRYRKSANRKQSNHMRRLPNYEPIKDSSTRLQSDSAHFSGTPPDESGSGRRR